MANETIFVTNKNDFFHSDKFDGIEYQFPPGEKVAVPRQAAEHMLGFGNANKQDVLVRLGWAWRWNAEKKTVEEIPNAITRLTNFVFTQAVVVEAPISKPEELAPPAVTNAALA